MAAPVGNQNAKKGKVWEQALKRGLARWTGESVDAGLDRLADRMIRAAMTNDDAAAAMIIERIGDRMDGKPAQAVDMAVTSETRVQEMTDAELQAYLQTRK